MALDHVLLTPPQLEVLNHLLEGATVSRAARKSSIHRSTIYVWLKEENSPFRAEYERLRAILTAATADRLRELHIQALDALEDSLSGPDSTPAVRLRAAIYVLGSAGRPDTIRHFPGLLHHHGDGVPGVLGGVVHQAEQSGQLPLDVGILGHRNVTDVDPDLGGIHRADNLGVLPERVVQR